jgi:hypothetical protein
MNIKGGCYCGSIRYEFEGDVTATFQCHCRECQYFTGGHASAAYVLPQDKFTFVKGSPAKFCRSDLKEPIERFFCADCGTQLVAISPKRPSSFILKVGTTDDPENWIPQFALFTCDKQPYQTLPDSVPSFEKRPPPPSN